MFTQLTQKLFGINTLNVKILQISAPNRVVTYFMGTILQGPIKPGLAVKITLCLSMSVFKLHMREFANCASETMKARSFLSAKYILVITETP
jgi:hypothetical protein